MSKYCYYNGKIIKLNEVKISPYDLGFMRGYGIFDAMRTSNRVLFCFDEHWEKFKKSANELNLKLEIEKEDFKKVVEILLKKNNLDEGAVKTILTGGESMNGFDKDDRATILILVDDLAKFSFSSELYDKGCKLISLEFQRCLPELKNINYLVPIKNQQNKIKNSAQEILYKTGNNVLECSTSNIFMIKNNILLTPKNNIFLGTTRNLVIKIAQENGFNVKEDDVYIQDLLSSQEVFLTATYKKIVPVVNVDDNIIGDGKVGKETKKLIILLDKFIENYKI